MLATRKEMDSLGTVEVPADALWGPQTQRSLEHFSIGNDLILPEMVTAYAIRKRAAASANKPEPARVPVISSGTLGAPGTSNQCNFL
jgi:fumarate hydratase class II